MRIRGKSIPLSQVVSYTISRVERFFSSRSLNLWKTFWVNFRSLPFSEAIHFPIFVYGRLKVVSLYGTIEIDAPIKRGMIRFGVRPAADLVGPSRSLIENNGRIIFRGNVEFNNGYLINVSFHTVLEFGDGVFLSNNVTIQAFSDIKIGASTRIAFNARIMSSDFHYSIDRSSGQIRQRTKPITIGAYNWITSDVKIFKGTVTPDWTIVTANSILNKDYREQIAPYSIIGGQPVKLVKEGQQRIFNFSNEEMLNVYFRNPENKVLSLFDDIDFDNYCKR